MIYLHLLEIFIYSLIQGLTEFFPISSSGHLVLAQKLLNVEEPQILLNLVLHLGSLVAIIFYFRKEIKEILKGVKDFLFYQGRNLKNPHVAIVFQIIIALIPTVFMGFFFSNSIERAFSSLSLVGIFLFLNGIFIFITKFTKERKTNSLIIHPFIIGFFQGIAMLPGFSRSGLTIGIALFLGWGREKAGKFSFLLFIPTVTGAFLFELSKTKVYFSNLPVLFLGFILATIFSFIFLRFLMNIIKKGSFYLFSFYCLFIGLIAFILSFIMK